MALGRFESVFGLVSFFYFCMPQYDTHASVLFPLRAWTGFWIDIWKAIRRATVVTELYYCMGKDVIGVSRINISERSNTTVIPCTRPRLVLYSPKEASSSELISSLPNPYLSIT